MMEIIEADVCPIDELIEEDPDLCFEIHPDVDNEIIIWNHSHKSCFSSYKSICFSATYIEIPSDLYEVYKELIDIYVKDEIYDIQSFDMFQLAKEVIEDIEEYSYLRIYKYHQDFSTDCLSSEEYYDLLSDYLLESFGHTITNIIIFTRDIISVGHDFYYIRPKSRKKSARN